MNATSSGGAENGMPGQFSDQNLANKMTAAVAPNVHNSYSPNRVFSNGGSNNSPNTNFAGHKMKSALAASTRTG